MLSQTGPPSVGSEADGSQFPNGVLWFLLTRSKGGAAPLPAPSAQELASSLLIALFPVLPGFSAPLGASGPGASRDSVPAWPPWWGALCGP